MAVCLVRLSISRPRTTKMVVAMITASFFCRRPPPGPSSTVTVVRILRVIVAGNVLHASVTVKVFALL